VCSWPFLSLRGRGGADDVGELLRGGRNPNGILSHSPGLRQRRYPGGDIPNPQPQRGYVIPTQTARPIPCRVCGETLCIRPEMFVFRDVPAGRLCIRTFCLWLMR